MKTDDLGALFRSVQEDALGVGASGATIGRNVFAHKYPALITRQLSKIIHEDQPASQALEELTETLFSTAKRFDPETLSAQSQHE
jgi:hypothetical protein